MHVNKTFESEPQEENLINGLNFHINNMLNLIKSMVWTL